MARVQILSKEEQIIFLTPPIFSFIQKEYYFKLLLSHIKLVHNWFTLNKWVKSETELK